MAVPSLLAAASLLCLWQVAFAVECHWVTLTRVRKGDVIRFTSPNYPADYPNLYKCAASFIPAASDVSVRLICNDVSIYTYPGPYAYLRSLFVSYDWVFLTTGPWIQRFPTDDSTLPVSWTSSPGKSINFMFSTNLFGASRGFFCTVIGVDDQQAARTCGQRNTARSGRHIGGNSTQPATSRQKAPPSESKPLAGKKPVKPVAPKPLPKPTGETGGPKPVGPTGLVPDDNKIFGGEDADPNEWPWMVFLIINRNSGMTGFCGGTFISKRYVLTAAHCFEDAVPGSTATLRYGVSDLASASAVVMVADSVTVHPDFARTGDGAFLNDIALVRLKEDLIFDDNVQPICLPSFSDRAKAYRGTAEITGWGQLGNNNPITSRLQEATAKMLDLNECKSRTKNAVTFRQLCSDPVTGMSVCPGDSGAPLKMADFDGRYTQIGLVSYGSSSCEADGKFAVYTRVDQYLEWIRDNSDVSIRP